MSSILSTPQWTEGNEAADFLDRYLRERGWTVTPTTRHEERVLHLGDRLVVRGEEHCYVEYKSGAQTAHTGNIFLETISVDTDHVPGWVYTCKADYLFYAILPLKKVLVFAPNDLRARMDQLQARFKTVKTGKRQNKGYDTHGLIVPLAYAEKHLVKKVISLALTADDLIRQYDRREDE